MHAFPLKIAMFTDTYTPQINGVVTSIHAFREELEKRGHVVHIFAPSAAMPQRAAKEKNLHLLKSFTFAPYPEYRVSIPSPELIDEFERIHADIIHIHTPMSAGLAGIGLARHFELPTVGTFHTLLPEYLHYLLKGRLQRLLMAPAKRFAWGWCKWFYNRCGTVIAPSHGTARLLKANGVYKPMRIIPTGIKFSGNVSKKTIAIFRKKYKLHDKIILHVGRVTREKNIEPIIDSLKELSGVTLVITSDGPYRSELQKYVVRQGLENRVRFLGYLKTDELAAAYSSADLFVCASRSETQGIVLLEAAAAGVPIVAINAPVVSDFVRENKVGKIVEEHHISSGIAAVLKDLKLRNSVRKRAKSIALKYGISRCTDELLRTYTNAINERKLQTKV